MSEKQYDVIVTPFAESALQDYYDRIRYELLDVQSADNWLDRMEQAIQELSELPYRFSLVPREPWYSNGVRYYPFIGYNIYYWVNEDRIKVYVIDVVCQKMDQDKRLIKSMLAYYKSNNESGAK
jgi:toxin ParE1/3/4